MDLDSSLNDLLSELDDEKIFLIFELAQLYVKQKNIESKNKEKSIQAFVTGFVTSELFVKLNSKEKKEDHLLQ